MRGRTWSCNLICRVLSHGGSIRFFSGRTGSAVAARMAPRVFLSDQPAAVAGPASPPQRTAFAGGLPFCGAVQARRRPACRVRGCRRRRAASRPPWWARRRSLLHSSGAGRSALPGTGGAPTYSAQPLRRQRGHGNAATASRDRAARCPVPLAREGLLIRMSARPGKRSAIPRRQKCSQAGGRFLRHPRDSTSRAVDRNRPAGPS